MWNFENIENNDVEYLEGVHENLKVKIVSVKHRFDNKNKQGEDSPYTNVCFAVIDGDHKGKLLNERFYCKATFKMAWLAMACGIYEEVDGKKVLPGAFKDPKSLEKRELYISTSGREYNGKHYYQVEKMSSKPLVATEDQTPKDVEDEDKAPF